MRNAMVKKLVELAEKDSSITLLTGDLGFGVFEQFEDKFPSQYFNTGIGEQNMIGVAAGLAMDGKKVIVYSIGNFPTLRCLEQIRNDCCYHGLNVTIVAQGGGFTYGSLGMSHHATEDLSILRALPDINIVAPSCSDDAGQALGHLIESSGVGYLRLEKTSVDRWSDEPFSIGRAISLRAGSDLALLAIGGIVSEAYEASRKLNDIGVSCEVVDMRSLKPIDEDLVVNVAERTGYLITVEENNVLGGLYAAVAEILVSKKGLNVQMDKIGLKDCYSSVVGGQGFLRKHYSMDSQAIFESALNLLGRV